MGPPVPRWENGGKWLSSCCPLMGDHVVTVVDVESKNVLFQSDLNGHAFPSACTLNADMHELAIIYHDKDGRNFWLETWSLANGKRLLKKAVGNVSAITDPALEIDPKTHVVNFGSAPYSALTVLHSYNLDTGAEVPVISGPAPKKAPSKGDPLDGIPIGDSNPDADVSALAFLATRNHMILEPHLDRLGMNAGAARSQDKATLALLERATAPDFRRG